MEALANNERYYLVGRPDGGGSPPGSDRHGRRSSVSRTPGVTTMNAGWSAGSPIERQDSADAEGEPGGQADDTAGLGGSILLIEPSGDERDRLRGVLMTAGLDVIGRGEAPAADEATSTIPVDLILARWEAERGRGFEHVIPSLDPTASTAWVPAIVYADRATPRIGSRRSGSVRWTCWLRCPATPSCWRGSTSRSESAGGCGNSSAGLTATT